MEIKTYYTDDKTKPIEYMVELRCMGREWEMAKKVIGSALWLANPYSEARPAEDEEEA